MPFTLLAASGSANSTTTDTPVAAVVDAEFTRQPGSVNNYIFTGNFKLLAAAAIAATLTRANFTCPTWNQQGKQNIYPPNASSVTLSPPRIDVYIDKAPTIPRDEQVQANCTCTGASDTATVFSWIGSDDWNMNLPPGQPPVPIIEVRFTATPTPTAYNWSALAGITFEQTPRGGTYAVCGMTLQGTGILAGRLVFPRAPTRNNVRFRPGCLASQAVGDQLWPSGVRNQYWCGEWGRMNIFEPAQLEVFGIGSTSVTVEGRLWLAYLSGGTDVVY